jgi:uncharacterized protein
VASSNKGYRLYLWAELTLLFIVVPILLSLSVPLGVKITSALFGVGYLLFVSNKVGLFSKQLFNNLFSAETKKSSLISLALVVVTSIGYTYYINPDLLFNVALTKPLLWVAICGFYTLFLAFPQEFIYRVFFYNRYHSLFGTHFVFVLYNSLLFAIAHLMFHNSLVLVLTFIGGLLFNYSYSKNRSYLLVSLEHAIYGCLLFTIGF